MLTWEQFKALPGTREVADQLEVDDCKCDVIAHYRTQRLFDAAMADLQARWPEKK